MEAPYYCDRSLRRDLAGSIDTIVLGASHALAAFDPNILDEILDCNSYNLSGSLMNSRSKQCLLEKELARNPVKTVILEISFNSLIRNADEEYGEGDAVTVMRLESMREQLDYMVKNVPLEDWMNIYSRSLIGGLVFLKSFIHGDAGSDVDRAAKGFKSKESTDMTIAPEDVTSLHCSRTVNMDYNESEVEGLRDMIKSCHQKDIEVILTVTPVSNHILWRESGWDDFRVWLKTFSEETGCTCYDFNLLKNRYELFNDSESFYDRAHLSKDAAEAFSTEFAKVLKRVRSGDDVSDLFYDTYVQMIEDSPYMQYLES